MRALLLLFSTCLSISVYAIVGGSVLQEDHPYNFLVGLSIDGQPCSGSYIGDNQILTAYHCFYVDNKPLKQVDWKLIIPVSGKEISIPANQYEFIKPDYTEFQTLGGLGGSHSIPLNDIVILKVDSSGIELSDYLSPIKVGALEHRDSKLLILGQGCYEYVYRSNDGHFRVGDFTLSSEDKDFFHSAWSIHDIPVKAGACNGDSGGPLVYKDGDDYIQVGVASYATIYQYEDYGSVEFAESHYAKLNSSDFD